MLKLNKRKCKSNTPIIFAVPKKIVEQIKLVPRQSLAAIKDNTFTSTDWYNITFRIKIAVELARSTYTEEVLTQLNDILTHCLVIGTRYNVTKEWTITDIEYNDILTGLDAVDEMTDETTRRIQLDAFHIADKYMKNLISK